MRGEPSSMISGVFLGGINGLWFLRVLRTIAVVTIAHAWFSELIRLSS
jgi:hypothetical protein